MIDYKLGTDRIIKFLLKEVVFGSELLFLLRIYIFTKYYNYCPESNRQKEAVL